MDRAPVQQVEYAHEKDDDLDEEMETPKLNGEGHAKTVTFLDDEDLTDQSSICQSPSWEGYGEKRKKKKEEAEQKRKEKERAAKEAKAAKKKLATRLIKEPPISESRPPISSRAASAPLLDSQHPTLRAQGRKTNIPLNRHQEEPNSEMASLSSPKSPLFMTHHTTKDNGFIGGVRLEREREAALRVSSDVNTLSSRSSTSSRPLPELAQQTPNFTLVPPEINPLPLTSQPKKSREHTPPPISYPPTSSKSFALKGKSHHSRSRSGSLLSEAAKLLNPRGQDFKNSKMPQEYSVSNGSQESVQTLQSTQDERRRPVDGNGYVNQVRSQSTERHINGLLDDLRLAQMPGTGRTRSSSQQTRSTSSNITASVPRESKEHSLVTAKNEDQEQIYPIESPSSPPLEEVLSPPAKNSPFLEARLATLPNLKDAPQTGKKSFKDAAKAALKASINPIPPYLRRAQTAPIATTTAVALRIETAVEEVPVRPSKPDRILGEHNASEVTVRPTAPPQPESTGTTDTRGSASSSSSYNDSSIPPSPVTTPDTSRPQSRRDTQEPALGEVPKGKASGLVIEDDERTLRVPYEAVTMTDQSSSNYSSRANSRPGSRDQPAALNRPGSKGSSELDQHTEERYNAEERQLASETLHDNWARTALPLDLDAQSFMGSFTNFELSTSEVDPNITPVSVQKEIEHVELPEEKEQQTFTKEFDMDIPQRHPSLTKSFSDQDISDRIDTSFLPPLKHQALPPKSKARANHFGLPPIENDPRPKPQVRTISFDSSIPLSNTAAAYLQEARHAVSTSPRPPVVTTAAPISSGSRSQTHPLRPALKSVTSNTSQPDTPGPKPVAKMFVECCACKFYHDMPSRVYECMARPNEMVEDRKLGVSGAITTCVKCPWCSHNMSTSCCAGYAAVVYLREKLHGP